MFRTIVKITAAVLGPGANASFFAASGAEPRGPKTPLTSTGSRVTLDQQKRTCVVGKPFFPIGMYSVSTTQLAEVKALGFNMVHTYSGEGTHGKDDAASPEAMRAYLDAAEGLGLKVFMGLPHASENRDD